LTIANYVTLARIVFIPLIIVLMSLGFNGLAVISFLVLSFSDAIDGYIARRFNQVSDLGKFLDPLADKILVITVLIALVSLAQAPAIAVMIIVARELFVQGIRISEASRNVMMAASPIAKWKTFTQIAAIAMLMLNFPHAEIVLWLAVALSLISGGAYLWQSEIPKSLKLK
jgi:CDP-diacylglycerol---glycerol-3-phosphate 3-phosphatidyltransferase